MKHSLLYTLILFSLTAIGQPPIPNNLITGGVCFDTYGSESTFETTTTEGPSTSDFKASLFAQHMITPRISVGGGLGIETSSQKDENGWSSFEGSESIYSVKAGGRYWMGCGDQDENDRVHPWIGAGVSLGFGSATSTSIFDASEVTTDEKISTVNAGVRFGVLYMFNDWLGLGASTGQIGIRSETRTEDEYTDRQNWFTGKATLRDARLSLNYFFDRGQVE